MAASDSRAIPGPARHDGVRAEPTPEAMTRIVLRPVASSLPLGFLAFGTGTILDGERGTWTGNAACDADGARPSSGRSAC